MDGITSDQGHDDNGKLRMEINNEWSRTEVTMRDKEWDSCDQE